MTIRRGEKWGQEGSLPNGSPVVQSDAELRSVVEARRRAGAPQVAGGGELGHVGLLGGDLCRTVGGPGERERLHHGGVVLPVDIARVAIDGSPYWFCSHLVARRRLWWGRVVVVMNAQWLGNLRLGPRAHPNDGLLDLTDGTLPLGDRWEARRRARTGEHVPHPALTTRRAATHEVELQPSMGVWLDGTLVARRARHLVIEVEPDSLNVVV